MREQRKRLGRLETRPPWQHQIQNVEGPVLGPRAKKKCFGMGPRSGPLEIKRGASWRVWFWVLDFARFVGCQACGCKLWSCSQQQKATHNLELGRPPFAGLILLVFLGLRNGPISAGFGRRGLWKCLGRFCFKRRPLFRGLPCSWRGCLEITAMEAILCEAISTQILFPCFGTCHAMNLVL